MKTCLIITVLFFHPLMTATGCLAQNKQTLQPGIPTDNPMRSQRDSLVDQRVSNYFKDKRSVGLSLGVVINGKATFYIVGLRNTVKRCVKLQRVKLFTILIQKLFFVRLPSVITCIIYCAKIAFSPHIF